MDTIRVKSYLNRARILARKFYLMMDFMYQTDP
jgi:hypothetical protein